jgi:hypothetical protein
LAAGLFRLPVEELGGSLAASTGSLSYVFDMDLFPLPSILRGHGGVGGEKEVRDPVEVQRRGFFFGSAGRWGW